VELLGGRWKNVDETAVSEESASRSRAVTVPTVERNFVASAKGLCERAWHLRTSTSIVMCASEQFHRCFSSIDYDARKDFCVFEFR
jgi:hypothetical protein